MRAPEYVRPTSPEEAVAAVADRPEARFLAGGTNLVDHLKLGIAAPDVLVDLRRLPLDAVEPYDDERGRGLRIGTNVRNSDLAAHPVVRSGVRVDLPVSGSSLKLIERAHVVTITGDAIPRVLLNNEEIAIGDLAGKLVSLKKESRYVLINEDSNASHGLWQRVVNEVHAAGCDPVSGTRLAGE